MIEVEPKLSYDLAMYGGVNFYLHFKGQQIGQCIITGGSEGLILAAIDVEEEFQRRGYATRMMYAVKEFYAECEYFRMSSSNEGSGTVQILDKVFGRKNVKHYLSRTQKISFTEAVRIMDKDFKYTRSIVEIGKPRDEESA